MAYEKHIWSCGEDITDALLNHMEEGIENASGGGGAVYELTVDTTTNCMTLNASYNDLVASGGGAVHLAFEVSGNPSEMYLDILAFNPNDENYQVWIVNHLEEGSSINPLLLSATSADEHFTKCYSPVPPTPVG